MILNTEKWFNDNKSKFNTEELKRADDFDWIGGHDRFYYGHCSCCGQYADMTVEDAECVENGMVKLSYTCLPCFIKHKLPLSDEEFDKVKEEIPEFVKKESEEKEKKLEEWRKKHLNTSDEDDDFFKQLCS